MNCSKGNFDDSKIKMLFIILSPQVWLYTYTINDTPELCQSSLFLSFSSETSCSPLTGRTWKVELAHLVPKLSFSIWRRCMTRGGSTDFCDIFTALVSGVACQNSYAIFYQTNNSQPELVGTRRTLTHRNGRTAEKHAVYLNFRSEITCKRGIAKHCVKDTMHAFLRKHTIFGYLPNRNPQPIIPKYCTIDYVGEVT
jgi:hypothetical protein